MEIKITNLTINVFISLVNLSKRLCGLEEREKKTFIPWDVRELRSVFLVGTG